MDRVGKGETKASESALGSSAAGHLELVQPLLDPVNLFGPELSSIPLTC